MRKLIAIVNLESKAWQWTILFFLAFVWGASFILIKKGLQAFSSEQVAAFRMFFAFMFLLPIAIKKWPKLRKQNIKSLLIVGFIGSAIPSLLFTIAQRHINSSLAGMLNSLVPLFTLVIGIFLYSAKVNKINVLGIVIGLVGTLGLLIKDTSNIMAGISVFAVLPVFASFLYGISANEIKEKLRDLNGTEIASLALLLVGPWAGIYLVFTDFSAPFNSGFFTESLVAIAVLALFSTSVAVVVFNFLIKHTTAIFATSVTYIIPIFAIMWGVIDGEQILFSQLFWIAVVLSGVYLVNKKGKSEK